MFVPRSYQRDADEALVQAVHARPDENPLVVLPTGTGKSLCIAMFMWRMLSGYPHLRMMMLTHVKELIEGNYKTLKKLWPLAPAGIYSAGLGRKDVTSQLTFAGVQSVAKKAARFGRIDFLLIDEAHLVGTNDNATYNKIIKELRKVNPHLIVIGFTATPFRMGSGLLVESDMFDRVVYDGSSGEAFNWFIEEGYLIKPVPKDPGFQLDDSAVSIQAGDFNNKEASHQLHEQGILEKAVDLSISLGEEQGRQCWLTFCQSIDDAELVADMYRYKGYPVEAVHSKAGDRDDVLEKMRRGELRGVTNRDILTTGFDHPPIDMITMLRLTRSPGLWVQMLGRGTRPVYVDGQYGPGPGHDLTTTEGRRNSILASPKQTCLVLDFVGNTQRLGPINFPNIPKRRGKGSGGEMVRACPQCSTYNHISLKVCEECGYEFPPPERIQSDASSASLVLDLANMPQPEPRKEEVFGVHRMVAAHHIGRGSGTAKKKDTMRVDYFCGPDRFSVWLCFEHAPKSFPRIKAEQWWKQHGGKGEAPTTVADAVAAAGDFRKPKWIKVHTNTKYPEVLAYDFVGTRFELPPELGGPPLQDPEPDPLHEAIEKAAAPSAASIEAIERYGDDFY